MKLKSILLVGFLFIFFVAKSQNKEDLYNTALSYMDEEEYSVAIKYLKQVIELDSTDNQAKIDLAYCYLKTNNRFLAIDILEKVIKSYKKAGKLYTPQGEDAYFTLGEAYFYNYEFDMACEIFTDLINNGTNRKIRKKAQEEKANCQRANKYFNNPKELFVTYLDYINSPYPDHSPVLTLDEKYLYFTSRRKGSSMGNIAEDGLPYEDIYVVDRQSDNPTPKNLGEPVNTPMHEATCDISADGTELLIYKSTNKGDIYYSKKENGKWTKPVPLPEPINTKYRETHASFSKDGKYLFFTSDRPGGYGGLDIYVAQRDENGNWTNIQNLGPVINTSKDEEGVFLAPDGKTLYFSSKGHNSMGGYDVFKSVKNEDGTWSEPENLGFPLNTVDDDVFFYPTATPNKAFYSSTQQTGEANIYIVEMVGTHKNITIVKGHTFDTQLLTFQFPINQLNNDTLYWRGRKIYKPRHVFFVPTDTVLITYLNKQPDKVILIDSVCKVPYKTRIFDYNVATKKVIEIYNPAHNSGKYSFAISTDVEHLIYYTSPNHIYDLLKLKKNSGNIYFDAELDTMIRGNIHADKYTVFDKNNTQLNPSQELEFIILAKFMKKYPYLRVELADYNNEANKEPLDNKRLKAVYTYLTSLDIDSARIKIVYSDRNITGDTLLYTITDITTPVSTQPTATPTIKKAILVRDFNFKLNKYQNPSAYPTLKLLAEYLKNNPSAKIAIYGYTDTQGVPSYNQKLSEKRANFVKQYLLSQGVNPKQIIAEGKGFSKQISINRDKAGKFIWESLPYNRRVEINVVQQGENQILYVKPITVPDKYKLKKAQQNIKYSVLVKVSSQPLSPDTFPFDVIEMKAYDGTYQYIYAKNFDTQKEAQDFKNSIIDKFPKAYVFINDYRN